MENIIFHELFSYLCRFWGFVVLSLFLVDNEVVAQQIRLINIKLGMYLAMFDACPHEMTGYILTKLPQYKCMHISMTNLLMLTL